MIPAMDWLGIAIGAGGLIVAYFALRRAGAATEAAERSNEIARSANAKADEANRISERSNTIAVEANDLIRTSVESELEARDRELTSELVVRASRDGNVLGLNRSGDNGTLGLRVVNEGTAPARDVVMVVMLPAGASTQSMAETVAPGREVRLAAPVSIITLGLRFDHSVMVYIKYQDRRGPREMEEWLMLVGGWYVGVENSRRFNS